MNIIDFKLFISINKQLQKAKGSDISSITFLGRFSLVVLIGDFYQFLLVTGSAFWDKLYRKKKIYRKIL